MQIELLREIERVGAVTALLSRPTEDNIRELLQAQLPEGSEVINLILGRVDVLSGRLTVTVSLEITLPQEEEKVTRKRTPRTKSELPPAPPAAPLPPAPPEPPTE